MEDQDKPADTVKLHKTAELDEAAAQANEASEASAEKKPVSEKVEQAREKFVEVAGEVEKKVKDFGKTAGSSLEEMYRASPT